MKFFKTCADFPAFVLWVAFSNVASSASLPAGRRQKDCQSYELYLDHGTYNCELCSEICDRAATLATEVQCQDNCPQYLKSLECQAQTGMYYDELNNSCRSCCDLCESKQTGRTPECLAKCTAKGRKRPSLTNQLQGQKADANDSGLELASLCNQNDDQTTDSAWATHPNLVFALIGSFATLCVGGLSVFAFVCYRQFCSAKRGGNAVETAAEDDGSGIHRQPVEESGRDARLHPQTVPLLVTGNGSMESTTTEVMKTAFSDLREEGRQGPSV